LYFARILDPLFPTAGVGAPISSSHCLVTRSSYFARILDPLFSTAGVGAPIHCLVTCEAPSLVFCEDPQSSMFNGRCWCPHFIISLPCHTQGSLSLIFQLQALVFPSHGLIVLSHQTTNMRVMDSRALCRNYNHPGILPLHQMDCSTMLQ
jgi:hypothetical protein